MGAMERITRLERHSAFPSFVTEERTHFARRLDELAELRILLLWQHPNGAADKMIAFVGERHLCAGVIVPRRLVDAGEVLLLVVGEDVFHLEDANDFVFLVAKGCSTARLETGSLLFCDGKRERDRPGVLLAVVDDMLGFEH